MFKMLIEIKLIEVKFSAEIAYINCVLVMKFPTIGDTPSL